MELKATTSWGQNLSILLVAHVGMQGVFVQGSFTCVICLIWAKKLSKGQNCNIVVNFKEIDRLGEKRRIEKGQVCPVLMGQNITINRQITRKFGR